MQYRPGSTNPDSPASVGTPWFSAIGSLSGGTTLFNSTSFSGYQCFLQGIDLVDATYTNGHNCSVQINAGVIVGGGVVIFQGFTYTTSQACFSWRGNLPLPATCTILAAAIAGLWQVSCYGVAFPEGPLGWGT